MATSWHRKSTGPRCSSARPSWRRKPALTPCGYPTTSTWLDEQGQSGFVWSMIGAISQVTSLPITTAVTSPLLRLHPAIVAQATVTSSLLTGGGFTLGVGG